MTMIITKRLGLTAVADQPTGFQLQTNVKNNALSCAYVLLSRLDSGGMAEEMCLVVIERKFQFMKTVSSLCYSLFH